VDQQRRHELTENIVHLVLARSPGRMASWCRHQGHLAVHRAKKLVDPEGRLTGERNDVALAGLNHKLGYRGIPNTLLNFGEGKFAVRGSGGAMATASASRRGPALHVSHENEAPSRSGSARRCSVTRATKPACITHATARRAACRTAGKDVAKPPVRIIEHADVKRMLLAQKAYVEGS